MCALHMCPLRKSQAFSLWITPLLPESAELSGLESGLHLYEGQYEQYLMLNGCKLATVGRQLPRLMLVLPSSSLLVYM